MTLTPEDPIALRLARFLADFRARELDAGQVRAMTIRLIDALACAALARADHARSDNRHLPVAIAEAGEARVIGGAHASLPDAAFLNCYLIRKLDWNDTYIGRNGGHPSDFTGAVIAAGTAAGKTGAQMLLAIAAGNHVMLDLCDAANSIARGWDPSTYVGLAATAALCVLHELDSTSTAHALAMTAVSGNMLLARTGRISTWKSLACAVAARNALSNVELARRGQPGPDPSFTGEFGFETRISGPLDLQLDPARDRTGDSHLKFYPAIYHAQGPIEAALALHADIGGAPIEAVGVDIYGFAIRYTADTPAKWSPETIETADHSLPFIVAHVLLCGEFGPGSLHRTLHDPAVRALAQRVQVRADVAFGERWPSATPSRLTVQAGGKVFVHEIEHIIGHTMRPLGLEAVRAKFLTGAVPLCGAPAAQAWLEKIEAFAELQTAEQIACALSPAG